MIELRFVITRHQNGTFVMRQYSCRQRPEQSGVYPPAWYFSDQLMALGQFNQTMMDQIVFTDRYWFFFIMFCQYLFSKPEINAGLGGIWDELFQKRAKTVFEWMSRPEGRLP